MERHQFVVIGLGSFGGTIATELARLGHEVLGVDMNERRVDQLADTLTLAVVADVTDEKALRELNIGRYDAAIVAIGENIEASILGTLQLKSMGIKNVWAKALTHQHHRILAKIGATRILHPEYEMGIRAAQALNYPMVNDYIDLGGDEYIVELIASEKLDFQTMSEVLSKARAQVRVVLVRRSGENLAQPDQVEIRSNDHIVLLGQLHELKKIARLV